MKQTICLNMIVKDEERVIARCLASVKSHIDYWVIVDTGSTDSTKEIIRHALVGIPGELHERPWKDFGTNRNEALELARGKADYLFIIDADETLSVQPSEFLGRSLDADEYRIAHRSFDDESVWELSSLVRATLPFRYEGVLHEVLRLDEPHTTESLRGPVVWGFFDSQRNTGDRREKYMRDAEVLEAALKAEPENARYVFYLAQSYRDAGDVDRAIEVYERRAGMGGFLEERYYSLLQMGRLWARRGDRQNAVQAFLRAYEERPTRAEVLVELAALYRETHAWALAELFARAASDIDRPNDILFVDDAAYEWKATDELAIACFYVGKYAESARLNKFLIGSPKLPKQHLPRVSENLKFALAKLGLEQPG